MLLSRKRVRESESPLLRGPRELLAFKSGAAPSSDGKRLLRDLVALSPAAVHSGSRDALCELLARLQARESAAAAADDQSSLEMARARLSSQELFLSVVLEWQRSAVSASSTSAVFRHDRASHSAKDDGLHASSSSSSSDVSSYAPSDEEHDNFATIKRSRQDHEVSPTSVHNVPGLLSPLRLTTLTSPVKRIGIYTPRARQELLRRYMAKRLRRLSQHKVRYGVRKTLANARPRVKGRFVKTETPVTAALVQQTEKVI